MQSIRILLPSGLLRDILGREIAQRPDMRIVDADVLVLSTKDLDNTLPVVKRLLFSMPDLIIVSIVSSGRRILFQSRDGRGDITVTELHNGGTTEILERIRELKNRVSLCE